MSRYGAVFSRTARGRVAIGAAGDASAGVGQHAAERVAELAVEDAVDDRVHGAVDVTEPREDSEDERRHAAGTTQRADQVDGEERTPRHANLSHHPRRLFSADLYQVLKVQVQVQVLQSQVKVLKTST